MNWVIVVALIAVLIVGVLAQIATSEITRLGAFIEIARQLFPS